MVATFEWFELYKFIHLLFTATSEIMSQHCLPWTSEDIKMK